MKIDEIDTYICIPNTNLLYSIHSRLKLSSEKNSKITI